MVVNFLSEYDNLSFSVCLSLCPSVFFICLYFSFLCPSPSISHCVWLSLSVSVCFFCLHLSFPSVFSVSICLFLCSLFFCQSLFVFICFAPCPCVFFFAYRCFHVRLCSWTFLCLRLFFYVSFRCLFSCLFGFVRLFVQLPGFLGGWGLDLHWSHFPVLPEEMTSS